MTNEENSVSTSLNQRQAEQIARLFSVAFQSAFLYGGAHPTAQKSIAPFAESVMKALETVPELSLIVEHDNLYIEEWNIDKVINTRRILQNFAKSGLRSVTFLPDVRVADVIEFFRLAGDSRNVVFVPAMEKRLRDLDARGLKLNYITYHRIRSDQEITERDEQPEAAPALKPQEPKTDSLNRTVLKDLERLISLKQILENPRQTAQTLSQAVTDTSVSIEAAQRIGKFTQDVNNATDLPSIETLLNAVYELKVELMESIEERKETGKALSTDGPLEDEVENLSTMVIVKLVCEEYRSGNVSVKRLAQIIRRMAPERTDLAELLPKLKNALLAQGMSLGDYLQLLRQLNIETQSENLSAVLQEAAIGVGTSVDEIITAVRADPTDAARLILLASEIRKGVMQDDSQVSDFLTEYIERISANLALSSKQLREPGGGQVLRNIVAKLQERLVQRLQSQGTDETLLSRVREKLSTQLDDTVNSATAQWMVNIVSTHKESPVSDIVRIMESIIEQESQLNLLRTPLTSALLAKGFSPKRIDELLTKVSTELKTPRQNTPKLPEGVLSVNSTLFFLTREIKQFFRYNAPFSTLSITIESVKKPDRESRPDDTEIAALIPHIFSSVKRQLRDLDLVGSLGSMGTGSVFIILALTESKYVQTVRERLQKSLDMVMVTIKTVPCHMETVISIAVPDIKKTGDLRSFIELVKKNHADEVQQKRGDTDSTATNQPLI